MIQDAFGALDPRTAQHRLSTEEYAAILGRMKPAFIHHPESKRYIQRIFEEMGCDLEKLYFDVPKMRSSTSGGYLTTGIAYPWHPHRDTWYSAVPSQINWWIPIYEFESDNAMAFHPRYWTQPIQTNITINQANTMNRGAHVSKMLKKDTRILPKPTEPCEIDPQIRIVCAPGGIILFSGAQMHSSVPNTSEVTRFSVDFRVVHLDDVAAKRGAPNIDAACTGSNVRDFMRATDFSRLPENVIELYNDGTDGVGELVYQPSELASPAH